MSDVTLNHFHTLKVDILDKEFQRRLKKNTSYSKRAFARDLGVSHSLLSLISNSKRNFSDDLINRFLSQAKASEKERRIMKFDGSENGAENEISAEQMKVVSDINYYTILGLLHTFDFKWNYEWVSSRIGIPVTRTKALMNKMLKLDLIKQDAEGKWVQAISPIRINNKESSNIAIKFNKDLNEKARGSLLNDHFDKRHFSSMTMAIDETTIDYAMERIRNFRHELTKELEAMSDQKEVYALNVQLFPLTKEKLH